MYCIFKGIKFRKFKFVKYKKFHGSYSQNVVLVNFTHLRYLQNKVLAKSKLLDHLLRLRVSNFKDSVTRYGCLNSEVSIVYELNKTVNVQKN